MRQTVEDYPLTVSLLALALLAIGAAIATVQLGLTIPAMLLAFGGLVAFGYESGRREEER